MGVDGNKNPVYFLIIGPSGAGLTTMLNIFSDFGFMGVGDIAPASLKPVVTALVSQHPRIAFSLKLPSEWATGGELDRQVDALKADIQALQAQYPELKVLFANAPETTLFQRYQGAGKNHALERGSLQQAIALDKSIHDQLKPLKNYLIDTQTTPADEIPHKIARILGIDYESGPLTVNLTSFGFQYGIPMDAELLFDIRFLKNPFYIEELRPLTGLDKPIQDYIFSFPAATRFLEKWSELIVTLLPQYQQQGKSRVNIAIGCTGGQHRSVCMTESLAKALRQAYPGYNIVVVHREMAGWPKPPQNATQVSTQISARAGDIQ